MSCYRLFLLEFLLDAWSSVPHVSLHPLYDLHSLLFIKCYGEPHSLLFVKCCTMDHTNISFPFLFLPFKMEQVQNVAKGPMLMSMLLSK